MMVDKKDTPDNVILFPKIPRKRPNQKAAELDAKRQEMMRLQHNKVYVQAISEQLTETMLLTLRDENIDITNITFLSERVDKAVTTKGEGKDIYAITIDYKKF